MIKKTIFLSLLLTSVVFGATFNFVEKRYSDAFDRSVSLEGEISFEIQKLHIKYKETDKEILYKNSIIELKDGNDVVELPDEELQRMSEYFKIILMLYKGDSKELRSKFDITKLDGKTMLLPKDYIKEFLEKITLKKDHNKLKEIKLFFKNNDRITISINDEIR